MLLLPKTTEFNQRVPMQRFYKNAIVTPAVKKLILKQIRVIYYRNRLTAATLGLMGCGRLKEIAVWEVKLTVPELADSILRLIDSNLPYPILFLLRYAGKYQAVLGSKGIASACKTACYCRTPWLAARELPLYLDGSTLDDIYKNFSCQIAAIAAADDAPRSGIKLLEQRARLIGKITMLVANLQRALVAVSPCPAK